VSTLTNTPRVLKGGLVLLDPVTSAVVRTIALQYNPDALTRKIQVSAAGSGDGGSGRSEGLRIKGPPVETIQLEAEIDATDRLDQGEQIASTVGIHPELAALESIAYPTTQQIVNTLTQSNQGILEIFAKEAPLTVFVWSKNRILPVRITEFSVTEEAFDANLNPIRAKVSLGMRVLTVDDLGYTTKGGGLFLAYHAQKQAFAGQARRPGFDVLGLDGAP
jgi:hypothetical protein